MPETADVMVNRTGMSLSSGSSQPTWEKTNEESTTKVIRIMLTKSYAGNKQCIMNKGKVVTF